MRQILVLISSILGVCDLLPKGSCCHGMRHHSQSPPALSSLCTPSSSAPSWERGNHSCRASPGCCSSVEEIGSRCAPGFQRDQRSRDPWSSGQDRVGSPCSGLCWLKYREKPFGCLQGMWRMLLEQLLCWEASGSGSFSRQERWPLPVGCVILELPWISASPSCSSLAFSWGIGTDGATEFISESQRMVWIGRSL